MKNLRGFLALSMAFILCFSPLADIAYAGGIDEDEQVENPYGEGFEENGLEEILQVFSQDEDYDEPPLEIVDEKSSEEDQEEGDQVISFEAPEEIRDEDSEDIDSLDEKEDEKIKGVPEDFKGEEDPQDDKSYDERDGELDQEKIDEAPEEELEEVRISFDSLGGSSVEDIIIKKGEKLEAIPSSTREDFIFKGWFTEIDTELFDWSRGIEEDLLV